jgi:hypothetical protein
LYICITANDPVIVGFLQKGGAVAATGELMFHRANQAIFHTVKMPEEQSIDV